MALNKFSTQLLVATLGYTLPFLVGVSAPAVAFDFQLNGTFAPVSGPNFYQNASSSFSGTFSTPGAEPVSTYTGELTAFNIFGLFGGPSNMPNDFRNSTFGTEIATANGGRNLSFSSYYENLSLNFSPDLTSPTGLSFSSGSISANPAIVPQGYQGDLPVIDATITPVPAPAPIGGVLFLPGLGYWLLRKKI